MGQYVMDAGCPDKDARVAFLRRGYVPRRGDAKRLARARWSQEARGLAYDLGLEVGMRRGLGEVVGDAPEPIPMLVAPYQRGVVDGLEAAALYLQINAALRAAQERRHAAGDARGCPTARRERGT